MMRAHSLRPHSLRSYAWKLALVVMTVAALAACGSPDEENPLDDFALPPGMEVPEMGIEVYQGADRLGGDEVELSQVLAQGKPVVLNFWAALCAPCRAEMPDLQRVHEQRQDEVTILGIDVGPQRGLGTREQGRMLLDELGVRYPAGTTFNQNVISDYEILAMPATLFIRPDGSLDRMWLGILRESKMHELIDDLLAS